VALDADPGEALTAVVSGSNVVFTVHGAPSMSVGSSLSLSVPLEILGSTGVNDSSGNPWDLVASGQVDKSYVLSSGDQVTVNYNETVTVASSYSLTLTEGSGSAVIDQGGSLARRITAHLRRDWLRPGGRPLRPTRRARHHAPRQERVQLADRLRPHSKHHAQTI
jgi:hypothetical protein